MLTLKNIKKSIKDKTLVNEVSFDVPLGAVNGLLGPNGAGKTTTFYIIAGLLKPDHGEIILNGEDISKLSMHKRSKLGIKYLKGRQLSGGQRRKVEIARTLAAEPKIILLDEPFAGIDPIAIDDIKQVLVKLKEKNIGILITDHNVREALEICDQAMIISNGALIADGNKTSLINNKIVKEVYLGNMFN